MKLRFTKMHGLGNDFVLIDATRVPVDLTPERVRLLADRHFGIGCDQLLVVEPPSAAGVAQGVDFRYRIFNADGGEVEQCGNGARCFARFVYDKGLTTKREIRVETLAGIIAPRLDDNGSVTVDMGVPEFDPAKIPFVSDSNAIVQRLDVDGRAVAITALSMGNPHAVQVVANVDAVPVAEWGDKIHAHPRFPARVNVGFAEVLDAHRIRLRVYERGAGETLACGTGACAAAVAVILRGLAASPVCVDTRGGRLDIAWAGPGASVSMTGPAVTVFEGETMLDQLPPRPPPRPDSP
ncbi:MAG: diaminopimelate epimerase [Azoarcus sp.]|jgi:diaminopimelate epimerase|nr:diaminopimelate epimerase [Azoarcus sp.]